MHSWASRTMTRLGSDFRHILACSGNGTEEGGAGRSEVGGVMWAELEKRVLLTPSQLRERHNALTVREEEKENGHAKGMELRE